MGETKSPNVLPLPAIETGGIRRFGKGFMRQFKNEVHKLEP